MTRPELEELCARVARWWPIDAETIGTTVLGSRTIYVDRRDESITPWLKHKGLWEAWISALFVNALKPGERFLDVGANVGWYSVLAHWAGAEVVGAVEASPRMCELLRRTFAENGINAPIHERAAWDQEGATLWLEQTPQNFGGMSVKADRYERVPVRSTRLDDLVESVDVLKIDVEGAEMEVWRGAKRLLQNPAIRVFMEFTPVSQGSRETAIAALREIEDCGFVIQIVAADGSLEEGNVEAMAGMPDWLMLYLTRQEAAVLAPGPSASSIKLGMPRDVRKPRLLWVSDGVVHTGFARVAHAVLPYLMDQFDVAMLAAHYNGDPHSYPYPIYPAMSFLEPYGFQRLPEVASVVHPDVVLVLNDAYYVAKFAQLRERDKAPWKLVGYMPMDGPNLSNKIGAALNQLDAAIFYTHFGLRVAKAAGFTGNAAVIPHGIDRSLYVPMEPEEARIAAGLDRMPGWRDAFIVGNVNRNQPRKRLDLTLAYFADWLEREQLPENVKLYLHCAPRDSHIADVEALARYFGIGGRLILASRDMHWQKGVDEEKLAAIYGSFDLQVSTTLGEGWGLTTMEGMACAVPQIVPDWSGLAEWARGAVEYVSCSELEVFPGLENRIGAVPDRQAFIDALTRLYENDERRNELSRDGLALVSRWEFEWPNIAKAFAGVLHAILEGEKPEAAVA